MTAFYKDALPRGYQLAEYTIEAVLGHGGFGVTYLARDTQLGTLVAIKEYLPQDIASRQGANDIVPNPDHETIVTYAYGLKEFLREGQALARFKHPNIVRVLRFIEANGTAYMVMEYEKGQSLSQYLRNEGPRLDQASLLRIFLPILNGLHAVHEAGMLHLDIKPENIYLREDGSPILIDFGSARQALVGPGHSQALALTPGYAPIEQYPESGKPGPSTDVYAIGATLYRCISAKRPVPSPERHQALLKYAPDPLPSAMQVGADHYPPYILESVDWALKVHAQERPQSARELQDALMARLARRAAAAPAAAPAVFKSSATVSTPPRPPVRANKTRVLRRRRSPLRWVAGFMVLGTLAIGIVVYRPALLEAHFPGAAAYLHKLSLPVVAQKRRAAPSARPMSANDRQPPERVASVAPASVGDTANSRLPPKSELDPMRALPGQLAQVLDGHSDWVQALAFAPDGRTLASASYDKTIRIWSVTNGGVQHVLHGHQRSINALAYSPDGRWLASAGDDASVRLWEQATGRERAALRGPAYPVYSVAFSPDGTTLAVGGKDRSVFVWRLQDQRLLHTFEGHEDDILAVAFSRDGKMLASAGADKTIKLWSLERGSEFATLHGHRDVVLTLAFSPNGKWLASGGARNVIKLWDPYRAQQLRNFDNVRHSVLSLAFSPDSRWLAAAGAGTAVTVWGVDSGNVVHVFEAHQDYIQALAFSPDGTLLASASRDHTVKLWTTR